MPFVHKGASEEVRGLVQACVGRLGELAAAKGGAEADKVVVHIVNDLRKAGEIACSSKRSCHDVLHSDVPQMLVDNLAEPSRLQPIIATECFTFIGAVIDATTLEKRSKALICNRKTDAIAWVVRSALDNNSCSALDDKRLAERLESQMAATAVMDLLARDDFGRKTLLEIASLEQVWQAASMSMSSLITGALLKVVGTLGTDEQLHGLLATSSGSLTDLYNDFHFVSRAEHALNAERHADGQLVKLSPKELIVFGVGAPPAACAHGPSNAPPPCPAPSHLLATCLRTRECRQERAL